MTGKNEGERGVKLSIATWNRVIFYRDCARRRGRLRISSLWSLLSAQGPQVPRPTAYVLGKVLKIKEPAGPE